MKTMAVLFPLGILYSGIHLSKRRKRERSKTDTQTERKPAKTYTVTNPSFLMWLQQQLSLARRLLLISFPAAMRDFTYSYWTIPLPPQNCVSLSSCANILYTQTNTLYPNN